MKEFFKWVGYASGFIALIFSLSAINRLQIDAQGFTKRIDVEAISQKELQVIKKDIYYIDKRTERIENGVITIQEILMSKGNRGSNG